MDPTVIAAIIGAIATVLAAVITNRLTKRREETKRHSIERFLAVYERNLQRAGRLLTNRRFRERRFDDLAPLATAIVQNVSDWKEIQQSFAELLNGLVEELRGAVERHDEEATRRILATLHEAFPGKKEAILTILERSRV